MEINGCDLKITMSAAVRLRGETMKIHPIYHRLASLVALIALLTAGCATTAKVSRRVN